MLARWALKLPFILGLGMLLRSHLNTIKRGAHSTARYTLVLSLGARAFRSFSTNRCFTSPSSVRAPPAQDPYGPSSSVLASAGQAKEQTAENQGAIYELSKPQVSSSFAVEEEMKIPSAATTRQHLCHARWHCCQYKPEYFYTRKPASVTQLLLRYPER